MNDAKPIVMVLAKAMRIKGNVLIISDDTSYRSIGKRAPLTVEQKKRFTEALDGADMLEIGNVDFLVVKSIPQDIMPMLKLANELMGYLYETVIVDSSYTVVNDRDGLVNIKGLTKSFTAKSLRGRIKENEEHWGDELSEDIIDFVIRYSKPNKKKDSAEGKSVGEERTWVLYSGEVLSWTYLIGENDMFLPLKDSAFVNTVLSHIARGVASTGEELIKLFNRDEFQINNGK